MEQIVLDAFDVVKYIFVAAIPYAVVFVITERLINLLLRFVSGKDIRL